jgi:ammonia channel protein AmtB
MCWWSRLFLTYDSVVAAILSLIGHRMRTYIFLPLKYLVGIRVSKKEEENGLDYYEQGERA